MAVAQRIAPPRSVPIVRSRRYWAVTGSSAIAAVICAAVGEPSARTAQSSSHSWPLNHAYTSVFQRVPRSRARRWMIRARVGGLATSSRNRDALPLPTSWTRCQSTPGISRTSSRSPARYSGTVTVLARPGIARTVTTCTRGRSCSTRARARSSRPSMPSGSSTSSPCGRGPPGAEPCLLIRQGHRRACAGPVLLGTAERPAR